jgi:hypothetical protein
MLFRHAPDVLCAAVLCAALALVPAATSRAEGIARVLGVAIDRSELSAAGQGPAAAVRQLHERIWNAVSRHYIEHNGLGATREEKAEVAAYHEAFERKDRAQRARKLEELQQRLAVAELPPGERERLEAFRAVLERMAGRDAERDQAPPDDPAREAELHAPWIEIWKMHRAIFREYGGVVALTPLGPYPQGAWTALIEDYERRGLLEFTDAALREGLFALLAAGPPLAVPAEEADFTPYWRRPIPSSYYPD